jgi:hypothetical protein
MDDGKDERVELRVAQEGAHVGLGDDLEFHPWDAAECVAEVLVSTMDCNEFVIFLMRLIDYIHFKALRRVAR